MMMIIRIIDYCFCSRLILLHGGTPDAGGGEAAPSELMPARANTWLQTDAAPCAVLCCAVLRCAALRCAALRCAALRCAALRCAALRCATLHYTLAWQSDVAMLRDALRCCAAHRHEGEDREQEEQRLGGRRRRVAVHLFFAEMVSAFIYRQPCSPRTFQR